MPFDIIREMFRRNSDVRLRDLERQITQGDMSVMPSYLQELVRTGKLLPDTLELAAILGYAPATKLVDTTVRFCDDAHRTRNSWHRITWEHGLTPTLLVFIGDWYLEHLTAPSSDAYFNAIQRMIPKFQQAYEYGTSVKGFDAGFLQELAYGAEGSTVTGIIWFVYNSCEFFDAVYNNLEAEELRSFSEMAIDWAVESTSSISYRSFCEYLQNRLLEFILPEICHPTIRRNPRAYHRSSKQDITSFDPSKMRFGDYGPGFYFAEEHEGVSYAGQHLYTADIDINSPLDVENATPEEVDKLSRALRIDEEYILDDDPTPPAIQIFGLAQTLWDAEMGYSPQAVIKVLKALGYDGIVVPSKGYWVAFDPEQITLV